MDSALVDDALRATYQLSPAGSGRLRRLTTASGLSSENVLSRVAIVRSLQTGTPVTPKVTPGNKGKEIKGGTLLGRPGPASLLIIMILQAWGEEVRGPDLKPLIVGHWERGLDLLHKETGGGSVVDLMPRQLADHRSEGSSVASDQEGRSGGYGDTDREKVAAALGREFGVLPIEVRRLLAMVGRFDKARARDAAERLIAQVRAAHGTPRVSESQALRVVAEWGLNRLGMTADDRSLLLQLMSGGLEVRGLAPGELASLRFLEQLGLAQTDPAGVLAHASPHTQDLGSESWIT